MANNNNIRFEAGQLGPGPAAYALPTSVGYDYKKSTDGRLVKVDRHISKAYSFGYRFPEKFNKIGPGPVPNGPVPKEGFSPVITRHGAPTSLKYTFGYRIHMPDRDRKPGPVDCQVDSWKQKDLYHTLERKNRGPHYSLSDRHKELRRSQVPAANAYFPSGKDGVIPDAMNTTRSKAPAYTLSSRHAELRRLNTPGPAGYHPFAKAGEKGAQVDRLDPVRSKAPQYSFGIRGRLIDKRVSPSPNTYDLRPVKGITGIDRSTAVSGRKAPSWGMGKRRLAPPMIIAGDNS